MKTAQQVRDDQSPQCKLCQHNSAASGSSAPPSAARQCHQCGHSFAEVDEVAEEFRATASEVLETSLTKVSMQTTLNELGADSLATIELLVKLEEKFGVTIHERQAEDFATVGDIVRFLVESRNTKPRSAK